MDEKHRDTGGDLPSTCHLEHCDNELFIGCPHCLEYVCHSHEDAEDHGCKGGKPESQSLQIIKKNTNSFDIIGLFTFLKGLLEKYKLQECQLQRTIASQFPLDMLQKISLNPKFLIYINENNLWKQFCHYPELYWRKAENGVLEKQQSTIFCLWKFNYDNECLLLKNWESGSGINHVKWMKKQKRGIKLIGDAIEMYGKHWVFMTDGKVLYIGEVRNEIKLHRSVEIQYALNENIEKIKIVVNDKKLFIIWLNMITAYDFAYPDYIPVHLYSFICDEDTKLGNGPYYDGVRNRIKDFHVYVLDNVIFGHEVFIKTGGLKIHVWNPSSGSKTSTVYYLLPDAPNVEKAFVKGELCSVDNEVILNVAVHLKDGTQFTHLIVIDINQLQAMKSPKDMVLSRVIEIDASHTLSLTDNDSSEQSLFTYSEILPEHIVFCRKLSNNTMITCRQNYLNLEFCIFEMKNAQRNELNSFSVPMKSRNRYLPTPKIKLFRGKGIVCVAVKGGRLEVIDLNSTKLGLSKEPPKTKRVCNIGNTKNIYFIEPKFVLVWLDGEEESFKRDIAELWDVEKRQLIINVPLSQEDVFDNITWHELAFAPPPKLIISTKEEIHILDFEQN